MSWRAFAVVALVATVLSGGCNFANWRHLDNEGRNQTVRVESGDRLLFTLKEGAGCRWDASCADSDVRVSIDHLEDEAKVEIRVHRGYDGPSVVLFRCKRDGESVPAKQFTIALYKRTGDVAFWE